MEKIEFLANGQWRLEKGDMNAKGSSKIRNWVHSGMRDHLKDVPELEGRQKQKSLNMISQQTKSRINEKTGEKEHLLYRAAPEKTPHWKDSLTSWTTDNGMAHYWGSNQNDMHQEAHESGDKDYMESVGEPHKVHFAWIPEKHIHSHVNSVIGEGHEKNEGEVLVHPHDINIFHSETPKNIE